MKYFILLAVIFFGLYMNENSRPKKIIFFGDSITELAVQPGGYISILNKIIKEKQREHDYELIGAGISGNKVADLYLRLEQDVLDKNPDVVVIFIGVNDIWHKSLLGTGTDADKFIRFYEAIINKLLSNKISVILTTPAVIGEHKNNSNPQDDDLNYYSESIKELSEKYNLKLCDLRMHFVNYIEKNNIENSESGILTYDGVHLNDMGNRFVAEKYWEIIKTL
ncbi:MAG: G-D-S-L family lipolytic protein [Ignavibacteriaceae bacterium]|nr:G-D-S-L family lipolytic protein [Ignavibacteriaceae bacterium]